MDAFRSKYESLPYCINVKDFSANNIVCRVQGVSFDDVMANLTNSEENNPFSAIDNIPDDLNPNDILADKGDDPISVVVMVRSKAKPIFDFS